MSETLRARLARMLRGNTVIRAKYALESVLVPLCHAVAHMHSHGAYHRDIKPENIFFNASNQPILGDLGISKEQNMLRNQLTWCGLGTPKYTAPETLATGVATAPGDIFSLGVVLYEMLMGRTPVGFWWTNPQNLPSQKHPRSCHGAVDILIAWMTHPDPFRRYQNVGHVLRDIDQILRTYLPTLPAYRVVPAVPNLALLRRVALMRALRPPPVRR